MLGGFLVRLSQSAEEVIERLFGRKRRSGRNRSEIVGTGHRDNRSPVMTTRLLLQPIGFEGFNETRNERLDVERQLSSSMSSTTTPSQHVCVVVVSYIQALVRVAALTVARSHSVRLPAVRRPLLTFEALYVSDTNIENNV